ncbi:hypothetical protein QJS66_05220 [Kocuria rhizophila]|nr:hypothetical protein QJS66_05220 [Kocuria rhizophila]
MLLYYLVANLSAFTQTGEHRRYPRAVSVLGLPCARPAGGHPAVDLRARGRAGAVCGSAVAGAAGCTATAPRLNGPPQGW